MRHVVMTALAIGLVACADSSDSDPAADQDSGARTTEGDADVSTEEDAGAEPAEPDAGTDSAMAMAALAQICVTSPVPAPYPGDTKCPVDLPAKPDALDEALEQAGVDRCSYGFSDEQMSIWPMVVDDPYQQPWFRPLHRGLLRMPANAAETEGWLSDALDSTHPMTDALLVAATRRGFAIDTCLQPEAKAETLALLSELPAELAEALVPVLFALEYGAAEFLAARGSVGFAEQDVLKSAHEFYLTGQKLFITPPTEMLALLAGVDHERIATAGAIVARAIEDADLGRFAGLDMETTVLESPRGPIVIGGPGDDRYRGDDDPTNAALLIVELGGDDRYETRVAAGRDGLAVSVLVDLGGADRYEYETLKDPQDRASRLPSDAAGREPDSKPQDVGQSRSREGRQGSGQFGIGLLFDLGSDSDRYRALTLSQGSGSLGVGGLHDAGGDDLYESEAASQGMGAWGLGVLVDGAGADEYRTFSRGQGFGYVMGTGILADGDGNDVYFSDPGVLADGDTIYPSAQLKEEGNSSFTQGAAWGIRGLTSGLYAAGGHGVLYDRAGNDDYTTGVYGQGTGYWLGYGVLIDARGDDDYKGLYYVQGAAAHHALALFVDREGNDRYNVDFPIRATSIGVGHEFCGVLHIDEGGDDVYNAPSLTLGSGNAQGIGGLINIGGNDTYVSAAKRTHGSSTAPYNEPMDHDRYKRPTIGIFVDVGGNDDYTVVMDGPAAANDAAWSLSTNDGVEPWVELSGGVDRNDGSVSIP